MLGGLLSVSGGGGGLSPLGLIGLIGWWDTSVTASMTLSGSNITNIADQSGLGHGLIGAGTVVYSATAFNTSFPGAQFINGNSGALAAGLPLGTGNTLTAWFVGTLGTGASSASGRIMSYNEAADSIHFDFNSPGSWVLGAGGTFTGVDLNRNNTHASATGLTASPAGHVVIITIDSSGVMTVYADGVPSTTGTSSGNWVSNPGYFGVGRQPAYVTDFWYGVLAEWGVATGFTNLRTYMTVVGAL